MKIEKLSAEEKETHINYMQTDDYILIETSIKRDISRCKNCGYEVLSLTKYADGSIMSVVFKAPINCFTFRKLKHK